jgi:membrane-bound lytic murein transglycosylase D
MEMKNNKKKSIHIFNAKLFLAFVILISTTAFKLHANEIRPKEYSQINIKSDTSINGAINWDELNPRAISFVKDYLEVHEERLEKMKTWGAPYFLIIENILAKYRLPKTLKYLAVIESDLKSTAVSHAGAGGPWQLMPETAKELGLIVTNEKDERTDLARSTHAASKYLLQLYEKLDDWLLVIAAYNGGPARVDNILKKKNSSDFWAIQNSLPLESRNHVKKFIATHYIFEKDGSETTGKITRPEPVAIVLNEGDFKISDTLTITGRYSANVIAKYMEMESSLFQKWNQGFERKIAEGPVTIRIPKEKLLLFNNKKSEILNESVYQMIKENIDYAIGFPEATNEEKRPESRKARQPRKTQH